MGGARASGIVRVPRGAPACRADETKKIPLTTGSLKQCSVCLQGGWEGGGCAYFMQARMWQRRGAGSALARLVQTSVGFPSTPAVRGDIHGPFVFRFCFLFWANGSFELSRKGDDTFTRQRANGIETVGFGKDLGSGFGPSPPPSRLRAWLIKVSRPRPLRAAPCA